MSGLAVCVGCGRHVRPADSTCPFCGSAIGSSPGVTRLPTAISVALGLALTGCPGAAVALYGASPSDRVDTAQETGGVDNDQDGFYAESSGGADCDDDDASVNPDATETAGDGVDSNCDDEDDT